MRRFPPVRHPTRIHRILAYGNSFTAGASGTPNLYPYAVFLQEALQAKMNSNNNNENDNNGNDTLILVDHLGNPGWTTRGMLNTLDGKHVGLRAAIVKAQAEHTKLFLHAQKHLDPMFWRLHPKNKMTPSRVIQDQWPLSLVLVWAGSNDLHREPRPVLTVVNNPDLDTSNDDDDDEDDDDDSTETITATKISNNLMQLHRVCLECGVPRTLAIGIPPSHYQALTPSATAKAQAINATLQQTYSSSSFSNNNEMDRTAFVPFPFEYKRRGKYWSHDGLHLTETGYRAFAESLVPHVEQILNGLDDEKRRMQSPLLS